MRRSAKGILGVGQARAALPWQCPPLRNAAENDAIEQTNIKQTSTAAAIFVRSRCGDVIMSPC